jgi:hypothetical protein
MTFSEERITKQTTVSQGITEKRTALVLEAHIFIHNDAYSSQGTGLKKSMTSITENN